jgi:hypothetical protein
MLAPESVYELRCSVIGGLTPSRLTRPYGPVNLFIIVKECTIPGILLSADCPKEIIGSAFQVSPRFSKCGIEHAP